MKIHTNISGNYNIHRTNITNKTRNIDKAEVQFSSEPINADEKQFFSKMYPNKKEEITTHQFYKRDGKKTGVTLGSFIDMRG